MNRNEHYQVPSFGMTPNRQLASREEQFAEHTAHFLCGKLHSLIEVNVALRYPREA